MFSWIILYNEIIAIVFLSVHSLKERSEKFVYRSQRFTFIGQVHVNGDLNRALFTCSAIEL